MAISSRRHSLPCLVVLTNFLLEYLISKYGKRTFGVTSEEEPQIWRDNLFCASLSPARLLEHAVTDSLRAGANYSEASLQPLIIRRYSNFKYQNTVPSFMRPVAKVLFSRLDALIIAPDLETHSKFVRLPLSIVHVATVGRLYHDTHFRLRVAWRP